MSLSEKEIEAIKPHLSAENAAKLTAENGIELLTEQMKELSLLAVEQGKLIKENESKSLDRIQVDPDVLDANADLAQEKLEGLVKTGAITPACQKLLSAALIGAPDARNVYALSRKATGANKALATLVIDALKDNKPVKLNEKTGAQQKVELSRSDDQANEKQQEEIFNRMLAGANRGR